MPHFVNVYFLRNTKSVVCHYTSSHQVIAIAFFTWHDRCAVVAYAKFCNDLSVRNGITVRLIFCRFNCDERLLLKCSSGFENNVNIVFAVYWIHTNSVHVSSSFMFMACQFCNYRKMVIIQMLANKMLLYTCHWCNINIVLNLILLFLEVLKILLGETLVVGGLGNKPITVTS